MPTYVIGMLACMIVKKKLVPRCDTHTPHTTTHAHTHTPSTVVGEVGRGWEVWVCECGG